MKKSNQIVSVILFLAIFLSINLQAADLKEKMNKGKAVYSKVCIACHQANAMGIPGAFPPLAKSDFLNADVNRAIKIVKYGLKGPITVNGQKFNGEMINNNLTEEEVANVLTFVYNSWGNKGGEVTVDQVKKVKK
jgi:nitrite reductase (NO-forming)